MNLENQVGGNECVTPAPICCAPVTKMSERDNQTQNICSPRVCSIFGGHDTNYYPEDSCSPRTRQKTRNLNTLGSPVGVVKSSLGVKSVDGKGDALRFATCLKAFAKIYLIPESSWDSAAMDQLLKEGQLLLTQSNDSDDANDDKPSDVYTETEAKVKRSFELDGYSFRMELNKKFEPQLNPVESSGDERTKDLKLEFIRPTLKAFFRQAKYCLARISTGYLLIWKAKGIFFILDFNGRRLNDFVSDREKGEVMLVCLKTLDNVCHLIENLSGVKKTDTFNLREMKVTRLSGPDIGTKNREHGKRVNQYEVISADYAFLKSSLHLTLNREKPLRSRSALAVAVVALLASKIDHPATWNQEILDKIICYGVSVFLGCLEQHTKGHIEFERFPNQLKIGQFSVSFSLKPRTHEGIWKCVPSYKQSELAIAIEKSFEAGDNNLIVQIDHQMYAIWKKNNFIYFFDPYRHRIFANLTEENADHKSASLRIFRSLDTFLSVFNQVLLDTNRTTRFYIHSLKIKNIQLANKAEGVPEEERQYDEDDEAMSLNEAICFEDDDAKCKDELGQISDYEEDDITTGVMRMDLKEPKSETDESEEGMEEEEGGALEDLGEYESSSSGDGDGLSGKKKKKSSKAQRDKKKSKGDKAKKNMKGKQKGKDTDAEDKISKNKRGDKRDDKSDDEKEQKSDDENIMNKPDNESKKKKLNDESQKQDQNKKENESSAKKLEDETQKTTKDKLQEKNQREKEEEENKKKKEEDENKKKDEEVENKKKKEDEINENNQQELENKKDEENKNKEEEESQKKKEEEESQKRKSEKERQNKESTKITAEQENRNSTKIKPHVANESRKDRPRKHTFRGGLSGVDADDEDDRHMQEQFKPNYYPGYSRVPREMAVVGSESGTYESINKLLRVGFKYADRILTMTPWGNYVAFRSYNMFKKVYFLFDGCTCNVNRFRHLDLNSGTAGLLFFDNLHDVTSYIIDSHQIRTCMHKSRKHIIDEICRKYC